MKRFSFRLEPVLNYRKLVEDREGEKLRGIHLAIQRARKTRDEIALKIEQGLETLKSRAQGAVDVEEIKMMSIYIDQLRGQMEETQKGITRLEKDREVQLAALLKARKGREVVERLKEDRLSDYRKEVLALEQKMLDELSVTQFGRLNEQDLPGKQESGA